MTKPAKLITRRELLTSAAGFGLAVRVTGEPQDLVPSCQSTENVSQIYYDTQGLIVQRDCDGGDTAQREGWYWFGKWVRENYGMNNPLNNPFKPLGPFARRLEFEEVMVQLEIGQTGTFRRNPIKWNDPQDFTRDQTIPLVAAMGVRGDNVRLQRFYHELRRRNWFAQRRGDEMTSPVYRNLIARARNEDPNHLTDAASLYAAAGARLLAAHGRLDDVGNDLNLIVMLLLATVRKPNGGVDKARGYYSKNRPDNYGMFLGTYRMKYGTNMKVSKDQVKRWMNAGIASGWKPDCPRVLGALRWYFRAESGGCPGLAELYDPIIQKWFQ